MSGVRMLIDSCTAVVSLLASTELRDHWNEPSALSHWTNAGLAGHLARSAFNFERAIDVSDPVGTPVADAVAYYTRRPPDPADTEIGRRIRTRGDQEAADGQQALVTRFTETMDRLPDRSARVPDDHPVQLFDCILPAGEAATACLLELVVHTSDLAVSLDLELPDLPEGATDLAIATLAQIASRRHGRTELINALARPERAIASTVSAF